MGRFGSGAFRNKKEVRGTPDGKAKPRNIWGNSSLGNFITRGDNGKMELSWEGENELKRRRKAEKLRRGDVPKALARRERHIGLELLFKKPSPISFKTNDGKRIRIIRHGFRNIYSDTPKGKARALVCVLVNGKRLFFYRSSGEVSNLRGEWFPTSGPDVFQPHEKGEKLTLGHITKMDGHPAPRQANPKSNFVPWVDEVRAKLKANEKKLVLHKDWGAEAYLNLIKLLGKIPPTDAIKASEY